MGIQENRAKVLAALRGSDYQQITGSFRVQDKEGKKCCCLLGVLFDTLQGDLGISWEEDEHSSIMDIVALPTRQAGTGVSTVLGIPEGGYEGERYKNLSLRGFLIEMNETRTGQVHLTFSQSADELEKLFLLHPVENTENQANKLA